MIAVSNTTPLRYLIAIGQDDLLGKLFEKVFVPTGVHEELTDARTPEAVRRRVLSLAAWFEVVPRQNHRRNNVTAAKLVGRSFGE
jgi:predicted nucleic acid-binding protein